MKKENGPLLRMVSLQDNFKALSGECPKCGVKKSRPRGMYIHLGKQHRLGVDWAAVREFRLSSRTW
jgi:hypothetical protein